MCVFRNALEEPDDLVEDLLEARAIIFEHLVTLLLYPEVTKQFSDGFLFLHRLKAFVTTLFCQLRLIVKRTSPVKIRKLADVPVVVNVPLRAHSLRQARPLLGSEEPHLFHCMNHFMVHDLTEHSVDFFVCHARADVFISEVHDEAATACRHASLSACACGLVKGNIDITEAKLTQSTTDHLTHTLDLLIECALLVYTDTIWCDLVDKFGCFFSCLFGLLLDCGLRQTKNLLLLCRGVVNNLFCDFIRLARLLEQVPDLFLLGINRERFLLWRRFKINQLLVQVTQLGVCCECLAERIVFSQSKRSERWRRYTFRCLKLKVFCGFIDPALA